MAVRNKSGLQAGLGRQGDEASAEAEGDGSGAVGGSEFGHDVGDVAFYGAFADIQFEGDLFVALAVGDQVEDVEFSLGEFGAVLAFAEGGVGGCGEEVNRA